MNCLVCDCPSIEKIYTSGGGASITSLGAALDVPTRVYLCNRCGHLQTEEAVDTGQYYDQNYNINTTSEDEDQLYAMVDGKPVFRSAHQTNALLGKLEIPQNARVLDYGCGPAHTTRALAKQREDLAIHLFDVSENYKPSWSSWVDESRTACYETPEDWNGMFDVIASFFALEHVGDPRSFADTLYRLLKPGGQAYLLVPNVYDNIADLIVVDHINHFCETSLNTLCNAAGLVLKYVNADDHNSAWTIIAERPTEETSQAKPSDPIDLKRTSEQAHEMARFWKDCDRRISNFEEEVGSLPATIYGSGFYGCYLYTRLAKPDKVDGFVDRNPHQQKKQMFGRSITAPETLPETPRAVWVGLNPRVAKQAIADLDAWQDKPYRYFYL